jgi:hypothetical protein
VKTVRLLLGAAGAAPVLGLLAAPATAAAPAAAAHMPKKAAKQVSLHTTSASPDAGCTGRVARTGPRMSLHKHGYTSASEQMGFFYTEEGDDDVCIGTVNAWEVGSLGSFPTFRVRIYAGADHAEVYHKSGIRTTSAGQPAGWAIPQFDGTDGVHRSWADGPRQGYVQVCTAFYQGKNVQTPMCLSP